MDVGHHDFCHFGPNAESASHHLQRCAHAYGSHEHRWVRSTLRIQKTSTAMEIRPKITFSIDFRSSIANLHDLESPNPIRDSEFLSAHFECELSVFVCATVCRLEKFDQKSNFGPIFNPASKNGA